MMRLIAVFLVACIPIAAWADLSSYRVIGISPTPEGAELKISYNNTWPTPNQTVANATVRFYIYNTYQTQEALNQPDWVRPAPFHKPNAIQIGDFKCKGDGTRKVPLNYSKLGLAAGQKVLTSVCFLGNNHEWGASMGREAGQVTLPDPLSSAKKNSRLRSRSTSAFRAKGASRHWRSFRIPRARR